MAAAFADGQTASRGVPPRRRTWSRLLADPRPPQRALRLIGSACATRPAGRARV